MTKLHFLNNAKSFLSPGTQTSAYTINSFCCHLQILITHQLHLRMIVSELLEQDPTILYAHNLSIARCIFLSLLMWMI